MVRLGDQPEGRIAANRRNSATKVPAAIAAPRPTAMAISLEGPAASAKGKAASMIAIGAATGKTRRDRALLLPKNGDCAIIMVPRAEEIEPVNQRLVGLGRN